MYYINTKDEDGKLQILYHETPILCIVTARTWVDHWTAFPLNGLPSYIKYFHTENYHLNPVKKNR